MLETEIASPMQGGGGALDTGGPLCPSGWGALELGRVGQWLSALSFVPSSLLRLSQHSLVHISPECTVCSPPGEHLACVCLPGMGVSADSSPV